MSDYLIKHCKRIDKEVYFESWNSGRINIKCKYYHSGSCFLNPGANKRCLVSLAVRKEEKKLALDLSSQIFNEQEDYNDYS